jgi:hypothetical protein
MPWLGPLLLILLASPLLMFVAHAIAFRALDRAGAGPTAHSSALVALLGAFVPVVGAAWYLGVPLCGFAYLGAVYAGMAILYIDVVNIAETSLHMHLLLELAWSGGVNLADLLDRYSAERMIAARLERLTSIGQVRVADGRCYIANRSTLHFARALDFWRTILGLPTEPPETAPDPAAAATTSRPL